jgi:hypothetical protein
MVEIIDQANMPYSKKNNSKYLTHLTVNHYLHVLIALEKRKCHYQL